MLNILQYGDPQLAQQANAVINFDLSLQDLVEEMMSTMQAYAGVGIAAPQVGHNLAVFILASRPNQRYPDAPLMEPCVMCNPSYQVVDEQLIWGEEGCLSLANKRFSIARFKAIEVRFQTVTGQWQQQVLSDFIARVFQHEFDHLQGITLMERQQFQMELTQ
ncbi:peptide deformylase [Shewanella waksmanii]|uniref:peptide deformylase n=1 Tax=Shewanella waksmanii TaxID=213783 RepID=UPI0037356228